MAVLRDYIVLVAIDGRPPIVYSISKTLKAAERLELRIKYLKGYRTWIEIVERDQYQLNGLKLVKLQGEL